jgi:hypothetical protein
MSTGPSAVAAIESTLRGSGAPGVLGSSGYRVGDYLLTTSAGSRNLDPAPRPDGRFRVYASVCYPSSPTLQGALSINVSSGEE